jgi:integrase
MSRIVRDTKIGSREARSKLPARGRPHWRQIEQGLHIGYRKPRGRRGSPAGSGAWVMRRYINGTYQQKVIGTADDYSDADGKAVLNFAQGQARVQELAATRGRDVDSGIGSGRLTVASALAGHSAHLGGQGQDTTNQHYHASAFILPELGEMPVADLTPKQLQKWLHDLARQNPRVRTPTGEKQQRRTIDADDAEAVRRRRSSANRIWNTLRAALNHSWQQGLVPSDTAWRRVKSFRDVEAARIRYLSIAESQRLINAADPEFRPLLIAALQTGARYSELARLKVADFNIDAGTLAIWRSKSGKPRHIMLTDEGAAFFTELTAGRAGGELMLSHADGSAWGRSHQQPKMQAACRRARIEPAVGIHILRHTWASLAVMSGMPLQVAARNLGHADTKMVERHYGHLSKSFVTDAIHAHAPRFGIAKSNVTPFK